MKMTIDDYVVVGLMSNRCPPPRRIKGVGLSHIRQMQWVYDELVNEGLIENRQEDVLAVVKAFDI